MANVTRNLAVPFSVEVLSIYRGWTGERDCLHRSLEIWQSQRIKVTQWTLQKGAPGQLCQSARVRAALPEMSEVSEVSEVMFHNSGCLVTIIDFG